VAPAAKENQRVTVSPRGDRDNFTDDDEDVAPFQYLLNGTVERAPRVAKHRSAGRPDTPFAGGETGCAGDAGPAAKGFRNAGSGGRQEVDCEVTAQADGGQRAGLAINRDQHGGGICHHVGRGKSEKASWPIVAVRRDNRHAGGPLAECRPERFGVDRFARCHRQAGHVTVSIHVQGICDGG
jgi:hypothetical protein